MAASIPSQFISTFNVRFGHGSGVSVLAYSIDIPVTHDYLGIVRKNEEKLNTNALFVACVATILLETTFPITAHHSATVHSFHSVL